MIFRETPNWLPGSTKISKNEKWVINYTYHAPEADAGNFINIKKHQSSAWVREYNKGNPGIKVASKHIPQYLIKMLNKLFR